LVYRVQKMDIVSSFAKAASFSWQAKEKKIRPYVPDSGGSAEAGSPPWGLMGLVLTPHQGVAAQAKTCQNPEEASRLALDGKRATRRWQPHKAFLHSGPHSLA
jgi:hypothetical protein